jgi:hypothetical protein
LSVSEWGPEALGFGTAPAPWLAPRSCPRRANPAEGGASLALHGGSSCIRFAGLHRGSPRSILASNFQA